MLTTSIFLLFLSIISISQAQKEEKDWTKLSISTGAIRGAIIVTNANVTAYVFKGVPYAEPPIGNLRFRAPVMKKKWEGELDATRFYAACQTTKNILPNVGNTSENCLHANIYTTKNCLKEKNCPVMYYIYGGAFNYNSPFTLADDVLIDNYNSKDIILVTVTYRLNAFGYINTGKPSSAPKNLSLLDMILGLEWTNREIHNFGGDKSRITIMGHSSGSISTDLIALSPKSEGLFHQVVPMSGPAAALSLRAGCATEEQWDGGDSFEEILTCLRGKPETELVAVLLFLEEELDQKFNGPDMDAPDGILTEDIATLLQKRRPYRMMIGVTDREFRTSKNILDKDGNINQQLLFSTCVMSAKNRGFKHPVAVGRACAKEYSKRPIDIPDLSDDVSIYLPTYESGEAVRKKGATVYKYSFEYRDLVNVFDRQDVPANERPAHGEDLAYVMGLDFATLEGKDKIIQQIYGGMFADFIKTGDPYNGKWEPTDDRNNYFKITFDEDMNMPGNTNGFHNDAIQFWTKTAPEVDKYFSKWDVNGSFSYKKLAQDLIKGLKDMGKKISQSIEEEIEKWKDGLDKWDQESIDRLEQVLNDILDRIHDIKNATQKSYHQVQSTMLDQQTRQLVRSILPAVHNATTTLNTKDANWNMWFWVAMGVCIVLAVMLFVTCCNSYRQYAKRRQYERLSETTRLIPSSSKLYG